MQLNALVASPSFAAWGRGPALDPSAAPDRRRQPRASVVYLAHLSEQERQLVVTLVLSRLITWMHSQPGTSDLRALVYLDEIFGFAPPTAAPPSKKPILTLMKQARAFGIGMVVATQNPVDLDYKAMANAGSWFVGRLQTERDKERVLEGLRSAAGGVDVAALDKAIGGLEARQFLLQSAHRDEPELFATRWAMSYLRGPLTKEQIDSSRRTQRQGDARRAGRTGASAGRRRERGGARGRRRGRRSLSRSGRALGLRGRSRRRRREAQPYLAARVSLRFDDTSAGLDITQEWEALYGPIGEGLDLEDETAVDFDERDFRPESPNGAVYVLPSAPLNEAGLLPQRVARDPTAGGGHADTGALPEPRLDLWSRPGESARAVRGPHRRAAKAKADEAAAKSATGWRRSATGSTARSRPPAGASRRRTWSSARARAPSSSPASEASLGVLLGGKADARTIGRAGRALGARRHGAG